MFRLLNIFRIFRNKVVVEMTNEQKPREFWIRPSYKNSSSTFYCTTNLMKYAGYQNIIHVIEYSAVDKLQKENEKLKETIYNLKCELCEWEIDKT